MCQSLVEKVASSRQLMAVSHPEILVLFENWLEEIEDEAARHLAGQPPDPLLLAERTGLSRSGAAFIVAKLVREGRL